MTGAREIPTGTDIGIRAIGAYDAASLNAHTFVATGSISGSHTLTVRLSRDRTMAIFHAATPYAYDEDVHFSMNATLAGGMTIADTIHFTTMLHPAPANIRDLVREVPERSASKNLIRTLNTESDTLPPIIVTVDDSATPGTIFFDNFGFVQLPNACFLFNADEHGVLTRSQELPGESSRDFKPQPNGISTYFDINTGGFLGIDSAWNVVDTFKAKNYGTDEHELRVFPDGSYALLGISVSVVNMDSVVRGGSPSAEIFGDVIQAFDPDGNLVFEWRGVDHYNIADSKYQDLTSSGIDFEHANSLDFDSSGNILLSNRHLCEISCINGATGDFLWRFGGAHNQFTLVGDSIWFSFQHDVRWIPGGTVTAFDNGNYDTITGGSGAWIQQSRAVEYALDTATKTATLLWQYHHSPETFSDAMGSVERLPNGNTFIGWGDNTTVSMTEVRPDNTTAFELLMGYQNVSYRAMKLVPDYGIIGILDTSSGVSSLPTNGLGNTLSIEAGVGGTLSAAFSLDRSQFVSLAMYDMAGRTVRNIVTSEFEVSGNHETPLDFSGLPNGPYECVLRTENATIIRSFSHF